MEYKVATFIPKPSGFGAKYLRIDRGWDNDRCKQFEAFLNHHANDGWQLHSSDYRESPIAKPYRGGKSLWLVCIFQRATPAHQPATPSVNSGH